MSTLFLISPRITAATLRTRMYNNSKINPPPSTGGRKGLVRDKKFTFIRGVRIDVNEREESSEKY